MTPPPRTAELLLEALGAEADFRDAVLGDLAEEFASRAERSGVGVARRWYYREAVRAAPHLLRNWLRHLRARDVAHLAGLVLTAYVLVLILGALVGGMVGSVMVTLGGAPDLQLRPGSGPAALVVGLAVGTVSAVMGGYIAAWLNERAPLVGALALGTVWAGVGVSVMVTLGNAPVWYRFISAILVVSCTAVGGIVRVSASRSRRPRREVAS